MWALVTKRGLNYESEISIRRTKYDRRNPKFAKEFNSKRRKVFKQIYRIQQLKIHHVAKSICLKIKFEDSKLEHLKYDTTREVDDANFYFC